MKNKLLFISLIILTLSVYGQNVLVDTAFTTDPGAGGAPASCIMNGGTLYGSNWNRSLGYGAADDFTIPPGVSWRLDSLVIYGYQTGSPIISTFTGARVQIWRGRLDSAGATVVYGDTTTNRLTATGFTGIYRVSSTTLTNTTRPIMWITLNLGGTILTSGYYWIFVNTDGSLASGPWFNPKVLPGRNNPPGQNGKQRLPAGTFQGFLDGASPLGVPMIIRGAVVTGINNNNSEIPMQYALKQNYPNPFNPSTTIEFDLPKSGYTKLTVINPLGQIVSTLVDGEITAGKHSIFFDGESLSSGTYIYKLESGDFVDVKKMVLVK